MNSLNYSAKCQFDLNRNKNSKHFMRVHTINSQTIIRVSFPTSVYNLITHLRYYYIIFILN